VEDLGNAGATENRPNWVLLRYTSLEADNVWANEHKAETKRTEMQAWAHVKADGLEQSNLGVAGTLLKRANGPSWRLLQPSAVIPMMRTMMPTHIPPYVKATGSATSAVSH
jgi:hypothetical protein